MSTSLSDYGFGQSHRKASEALISAVTGDDTDYPTIIANLDRAESLGRQAFVQSQNTRQRALEFGFLQTVYGVRTVVETGLSAQIIASTSLDNFPFDEDG